MKKLFPDTPDVSQRVANRAARIVERHLRTHQVTRARDLPEEARVRLLRDLRVHFEGDGQNPPGRGGAGAPPGRQWSCLWERILDFLGL